MAWFTRRRFSPGTLIVAVAIWMVLFCNYSFFKNVLGVYSASPGELGFVASLGILITALTVLLLSPFLVGRALKPLLIGILLIASMTAYFMDTYNVIVSSELLESGLQTDLAESIGLLSWKLILYLGLLGILPALLVYRTPIQVEPMRTAVLSRAKLFGGSLAVVLLMFGLFNGAYASFFREHKSLRFYTNPTTPIYTAVRYASDKIGGGNAIPYRQIGLDATQEPAVGKRRLLVVVVGETARADHFSLNGYDRNTNPMLAKHHVASFDNVWSCGTATAVSVPCMFSVLDREHYSERQAKATDNVLDILQRAGVNVAWLDNNSDSKGVALRIPYVNYRDRDVNPVCDTECRDVGMLEGVKEFVAMHPRGDIVIVLHQMGSHGPEYAKRYPESQAFFAPSCHSNLLESCSEEEINNAYDNSIRYTDYFLGQVIDYLQGEAKSFSPAMLYLSDHGESLGERGLYLHGFPYALAPDAQKRVPMIFWSSGDYPRVEKKLSGKTSVHQTMSQDYLFHTLLGLMRIQTDVYRPELDAFANG
ncbi:phosphoethanolamine transferase [Microbulbifer sp. ALW1]|uniref:phosphoethanolamine transferase n=1 Tax=Microbulbifer sp. (strain ALW1) TaxID=1516059 RepID=UPI00135745A4|nr:phosphoethanolamine--lipid A transferase [Microbulbifer sp. ALW1]